MMIIGCDFHPGFQQIAYVELETGEYGERRLNHPTEAEQFYRSLAGKQVRIGVEATGGLRWFRKLMHELGHELLLGDASAIRASSPRKQKTDMRDARHMLRLLVENRFPAIWQPSAGNEEQRQLLLHRCRLVRIWSTKRLTFRCPGCGRRSCCCSSATAPRWGWPPCTPGSPTPTARRRAWSARCWPAASQAVRSSPSCVPTT